MESHRLDRLTRDFARVLDRRRGLQGLLALGAVPLGVTMLASTDVAEAGKKCKPSCDECQQCKKGKCHKTNSGKKKCKKGKCQPKDNGTVCSTGTCQAGICQSTPPSCTGLKPTASGATTTQGLQEAINQAGSGDTLTLCTGTWNLTSTVLIDKDLTLRGAGAAMTILDGGNAVRVLQVAQGSTVKVQDLKITKGAVTSGRGGGIRNLGTLTLQNSAVTGSTADQRGGGILNDGTLTVQDSTVSGNSSVLGGGISNDFGTVTLGAGSNLTGNTATSTGGGIINFGTLTMKDGSSVTGNTASTGGGINTQNATVTMESGSSVSDNTATSLGGGFFVQNGTVTLQAGSSVSGNNIGGINNANGGTVNIATSTIVTGNTPNNCSGQAVSPPSNCIG